MPAGRADELPTGRSMPVRRADEWFRPEGSMPIRRLVDADWKGRCDADQGWSMLTKVGRCPPARSKPRRIPTRPEQPECEQSELQKEPEFRKNTGTKNSQRVDLFGNTGSSIRAEDIREPRHPEGRESEADAKSETGTEIQDGKPDPSCRRYR
jgi:hypothetical protein